MCICCYNNEFGFRLSIDLFSFNQRCVLYLTCDKANLINFPVELTPYVCSNLKSAMIIAQWLLSYRRVRQCGNSYRSHCLVAWRCWRVHWCWSFRRHLVQSCLTPWRKPLGLARKRPLVTIRTEGLISANTSP